MTLLNGEIQELFGAVFASVYDDGQLKHPNLVSNGKGGYTVDGAEPFTTIPIKVSMASWSAFDRQSSGIPDTDVRLLVLQGGPAPVSNKPVQNDIVVFEGSEYKVFSANQDPAHAYWDLRTQPTNG